jgi:hypothetical protein
MFDHCCWCTLQATAADTFKVTIDSGSCGKLVYSAAATSISVLLQNHQ